VKPGSCALLARIRGKSALKAGPHIRMRRLMAGVYKRGATQRHAVVPRVVPTEALLAGADWRSNPLTRWNDNGQR